MIYLLLTQWRVFNLIIRAFSSSVSNAKYLAFSTPNTKNKPSWGVSNAKNFGTLLQYRLKYETVWTKMAKFYIIIILFTFSLSSSQISLSPSSHLSHLCLLYSSSIACRSPKATTRCRCSPLATHLRRSPADRLCHSPKIASFTR